MEFVLESGRKGKVVVVFEGEENEISSHKDELKYPDSDIRQHVNQFAKSFLDYLFGKAKKSYLDGCGGTLKYHESNIGTPYWQCDKCGHFTDQF